MNLCAQDLDGIYEKYDEDGAPSPIKTHLILNENQFEFIEYFNYQTLQHSSIPEVLAQGQTKKISSSFVELNSDESFFYSVYDSIIIKPSFDSRLQDSLCIRISNPIQRESPLAEFELYLSLDFNSKNTIRGNSPNASLLKKEGNINKNESFTISFTLKRIHFRTVNIYERYYGRIFIDFPSFVFPNLKYETDINTLDIYIPHLTNNYINRHCIKGEYIRVDNDKLYWRGNIYEKIKK